MLLTGRNGPVFNQQLCQIVQGTGVQFDLMATKPTTVALINDSKETADNTKQTYLKIHTFCTKHDIIYHILFQYPSIQHMQVWDDRPQQIAKFREAGHDWLNSKMLKSFEVIAVEIPHKYLDPDREREMVLAMVDVHNQQVEVEQEGGPFMVAGIGPMPWTRPELEGKGIWNPYETYSPRKRSKIEMINAVQYTGIVFSKPVQALLQGIAIGAHKSHGQPLLELPSSLQDVELSKWVVSHDPHVLLCPGSAPQDYMTSLGGNGAAALVEVIAVGVLDGQIWALEVRPISLESLEADESTHSRIGIVTPNGDIHESIESFWNACAEDVKALSKQKYTVDLYHLANVSPQVPNSVLYITMAHDRFRGARPTDSAKITTWEPVRFSGPWERLILVGKIGKKHLLGMKSRHGQNAVIVRAEVSIANVIKGISSAGGKEPLGGKMLGEMIKKVQKEMEVLSIENKNDNREKITAIVDDLLNRPI
ncbi:hypothetical protein BGW38_000709 [Lunasporangiospora selenospora]|uniref:Swiss Army Knife RNA repair protein HAD domain-containing protein n=1 Tax=Lunasporangiospora selenospora TaxID=979761 RepID=A0A9P6FVA7_9FUNG|nr:hypothetical protein BGW38_000709 [Lunasporangiospora selenospora]